MLLLHEVTGRTARSLKVVLHAPGNRADVRATFTGGTEFGCKRAAAAWCEDNGYYLPRMMKKEA